MFHFLPGVKIYVPIRYQNKFKQKDLFLSIPLLPGANRNVPFRPNFILERRETFLFVPIFPGANRNVPFCSNFCLERKDLFQFDIESNIKKSILCVFISISLTLLLISFVSTLYYMACAMLWTGPQVKTEYLSLSCLSQPNRKNIECPEIDNINLIHIKIMNSMLYSIVDWELLRCTC